VVEPVKKPGRVGGPGEATFQHPVEAAVIGHISGAAAVAVQKGFVTTIMNKSAGSSPTHPV
jgi:hypothetical protein